MRLTRGSLFAVVLAILAPPGAALGCSKGTSPQPAPLSSSSATDGDASVRNVGAANANGIAGNRNAGNDRPAELDGAPPSAEAVAIVAQLKSAEEATQKKAFDALAKLAKTDIPEGDALLFLRTAGEKLPATKAATTSAPVWLIRASARRTTPRYIAVIRDVFVRLPDDAKTEAIDLLARVGSREATSTMVDLVSEGVKRGDRFEFRADAYAKKPQQADLLFPRLLDSARGPAARGIFALTVAYAEAGALGPQALRHQGGRLLEAYSGPRAALLAHSQRAPGGNVGDAGPASALTGAGATVGSNVGWLWAKDYAETRELASLLLDLMGHARTAEVERELQAASTLRDPRLAYFAVVSLLRHGKNVDAAVLEPIAASAETRNWLFGALKDVRKDASFPAKWRTQAALAESDLVRWLTFGTELGRAPDEIELMKVFTGADADGELDWFLFRFRTQPPHWSAKDDWVTGVAGPFRRKDEPTIASLGDTFSKMTPWASKKPDEHFADVAKLTVEWREKNKKPK